MKLDKLAGAMHAARKCGVDGLDVMLLDYIANAKKQGEEVTIMNVVRNCGFAAEATALLRLRKLYAKKMLSKAVLEGNQKYRVLEFGVNYPRLVAAIADI